MSLRSRAVVVANEQNLRTFFDSRSVLRRMIDSDLESVPELLDMVEEWANGGDIVKSFPTRNEMANFLSEDEIIGKHGSRTTFAKWLKDASQGKFDFETARAAIQLRKKSHAKAAGKDASDKPVKKRATRSRG